MLGIRFICRRHVIDGLLVCCLIALIFLFLRRGAAISKGEGQARAAGQVPEELARNKFEYYVEDRMVAGTNKYGASDEHEEGDMKSSVQDRLKGEQTKKEPRKSTIFDLSKIDPRVKNIGDVRSTACRQVTYVTDDDTSPDVTIIVTFTDYEFYDVKNTLGSLIEVEGGVDGGDWQLIKEIIVVDDATSLEYILEEALTFIKGIPRTRILRGSHIEPAGIARSRAAAVKEAQSSILVFLDCRTLVTRGWLEPLVDLLKKDSTAFAVPHYDLIHDPVSLDYMPTDDQMIAIFSWSLAIRMRGAEANSNSSFTTKYAGWESGGARDRFSGWGEGSGVVMSPVLRGNAYAVRKDYFTLIGGYEGGGLLAEDRGGGEHLELSLRTWLCGGSIKVVQCSRVGILNLHDPVKVTSPQNILQIAELWFGKYKQTVLRSANLAPWTRKRVIRMKKSAGSDGKVSYVRSVSTDRKCHDMDWYLQTVAKTMVTPSVDAILFGVLRVKTGRCSKLLSSMRVKLDDCKPSHYSRHPAEMFFELTRDGLVKIMDKCLTTKDNAYILAEKCRPGDSRQQWKHLNEQLINVWASYCAMHVTDPDLETEGDRQIMMAQDCAADMPAGEPFKQWEFISI